MSVDYEVKIMYGKQYDCVEDVLDYLFDNGHITELELQDLQEYPEDLPNLLTFEHHSLYSGGVGVVGYELTAQTIHESPTLVSNFIRMADETLGEGCGWHEFVQVS